MGLAADNSEIAGLPTPGTLEHRFDNVDNNGDYDDGNDYDDSDDGDDGDNDYDYNSYDNLLNDVSLLVCVVISMKPKLIFPLPSVALLLRI